MVRLTLVAAAAIFATTFSAPLDVVVRQASASPTHSPQLSQPVQPSQTTMPTISSTPATGSNAPTSPTPSMSTGASPAASGEPAASSGAPAASTAPTAPTPAAATPGAAAPGAAAAGDVTPLEIEESPMASPDASTDPRPPCFPNDATVQLESGATKRMDEVVVGDRVAVGSGKFSEVFMFTHKLADIKQQFLNIKTVTGASVRMTAGHYLPVNGKYVPAREAKVGDIVTIASGQSTKIAEITSVAGTGLYNPQTSHGDIIVDGVLASTYTTAVERNMAHAMLAPLRALSEKFGMTTTMLDAGCDVLARYTSVFA